MLPQYNPLIHHRRSIRLHGYDYAQSGLYFITICCQDRLHLFGHIQNGEMIYDDAGRMIEKWYRELENKYPDKRRHEIMVTPNHFHCIIENMADADLSKQLRQTNTSLASKTKIGNHLTANCGNAIITNASSAMKNRTNAYPHTS